MNEITQIYITNALIISITNDKKWYSDFMGRYSSCPYIQWSMTLMLFSGCISLVLGRKTLSICFLFFPNMQNTFTHQTYRTHLEIYDVIWRVNYPLRCDIEFTRYFLVTVLMVSWFTFTTFCVWINQNFQGAPTRVWIEILTLFHNLWGLRPSHCVILDCFKMT